ncbi:442_t:CDS:2, partial [Ambispora leptoticha]
GAFDPLRAIGKIAKRYNLWFHIDGSWGGNLIFSEKRRYWLDGSELADTFTLNPHKMLGTPLLCSFLLARDRQIFVQSNALGAGYLFHGNEYDLGDGAVGCGRRPDAVKLFLGWKFYGMEGYKERIEHAFKMAHYLTSLLINHHRFRLVLSPPPTLQICFWYIPKDFPLELEHTDYDTYKQKITAITKEIHQRVSQTGKFMIDYAPMKLAARELPVFFRVVVNAPTINEQHLEELIDEIESKGEEVLEWLKNREEDEVMGDPTA